MGLLLNRNVIIGIVLMVVIGGGVAYAKMVHNLRQQVAELTEQTQILEATNRALLDDVERIQQAQLATARKLESIRLGAIQATRSLQARTYNAHDIPALQQQVNQDMTDVLQRLGNLSHAP